MTKKDCAALLLLAAFIAALFLHRSPEPNYTSGAYDLAVQREGGE